MVQAGNATDAVIDSLIPLLETDDIIIDGGNAKWTDSTEREKKLNALGLHFVGSGVSGGEEGARLVPHSCLDVVLKHGRKLKTYGMRFRPRSIKKVENP